MCALSIAIFFKRKTWTAPNKLRINCWVSYKHVYPYIRSSREEKKNAFDLIEGLTFVIGNHFTKLSSHFEYLFFPVIENVDYYFRKGRNRVEVSIVIDISRRPISIKLCFNCSASCVLRSFICDFTKTHISTLASIECFPFVIRRSFFLFVKLFYPYDLRFI